MGVAVRHGGSGEVWFTSYGPSTSTSTNAAVESQVGVACERERVVEKPFPRLWGGAECGGAVRVR